MSRRSETPMLGAGLIGIGRKWGYVETPIPSEEEALQYLQEAYKQGVRFFDTAPSYGASEKRLGKFLSALSRRKRRGITVATKFGEHWDEAKQEPYVNHSYDALTRSIDQSISLLGVPDILLLHKTTPQVLKSKDFAQAIDYARQQRIQHFGASVSDFESAQMVLESDILSYIQLPFNQQNTKFEKIIPEAHARGKTIIVNRPFNMGEIVNQETESISKQRVQAYNFVVYPLQPGDVILTGTKSSIHLAENFAAFKTAIRRRG